MSPLQTPNTRPNSSSNSMAQWRQLQSNNNEQCSSNNTHVRGERIFNNTFGDRPGWIDQATALHIVTQNVQVIKPIANDNKLQSGLTSMVSLQARITCLAESNIEWRKYGFRKGYKEGFNKLYAASRHISS
jgi:hypothetical protein